MNILLTCSGRRNYLVEYFKKSPRVEEVYAANNTLDISSMCVCDESVVMPSIYSDKYVEKVKNFCDRKDVSLVVSLFDLELPILARNRKRFSEKGVTVAVSSPQVCMTCLDKMRMKRALGEVELSTSELFTNQNAALDALDRGKITFPLFVKPRLGMGSIAIHKVRNVEQLRVCYEMVQDEIQETYLDVASQLLQGDEVVIQEALPGSEYGLDVVNDFQGNYVATLVKRKLGMRSGETDGAVTEDIPELRAVGKKLSEALGHVGNLDADVFWDGEQAHVLDVNPRLGGGYPFSHVAGADLPTAYVAWTQGEDPDSSCFEIEHNVKAVKGISLHKATS